VIELLTVLAAILIFAGTIYALRGGLRAPQGLTGTIVGFDSQSLALGVLAVAAAAYFWGPYFGLSLVFAVAVHEFGHVAAYRVCGHKDARFRLIPLLGGVAISNSAPASQEKDFFITLMGPAICIAPVILATVASYPVYRLSPQLGEFLWVFGSFTAAFNFFNLLPFWPLDGGRMVHTLSWIYWKGGARYIAIGMSALFAAFAFWNQSVVMFLFAMMGAQSLVHAETINRIQRPMSKRRGLWAMAAYLAVAAVHFYAGLPFLVGFIR
jgi:Zn-dependent protease